MHVLIPAAEGYSRRSGIAFGHGLVKNRYIGRTFIAPSQGERDVAVPMKLNPIRENIHAGTEMIAPTSTDAAVRAIAHHHEVGIAADCGEVIDLATVLHLNPEVGGTLGESIE